MVMGWRRDIIKYYEKEACTSKGLEPLIYTIGFHYIRNYWYMLFILHTLPRIKMLKEQNNSVYTVYNIVPKNTQ